jgi:hypothetical protein
MSKLYKLGISGSVVLICLGWLLNCAALRSADSPAPVPTLNTREVIYSDWIAADHWVKTSVFGLPARAQELTQSRLTPTQLENGQLYVYTKLNDEVRTLPFTLNKTDTELRFDYTVLPNAHLRLVEISLKGLLQPVKNQKFRYVLIPNQLINQTPINMDDYSAVQAALGLTD